MTQGTYVTTPEQIPTGSHYAILEYPDIPEDGSSTYSYVRYIAFEDTTVGYNNWLAEISDRTIKPWGGGKPFTALKVTPAKIEVKVLVDM